MRPLPKSVCAQMHARFALHWIWITLVLLAIATQAPCAVAATPEGEVDQIEDLRYAAMINRDWTAFAAILGDEFMYHQPNGNVATKAGYIEQMKSGEVRIKKAVRDGVKIRQYGDLAVVTGGTSVDLVMKGEAKNVYLRYLNVWAKRDNRWQLAARQSAFEPAPK